MSGFSFEWLLGGFETNNQKLLEECSRLYSEHYGKWSDTHADIGRRGKAVQLSAKQLAIWLRAKHSSIYLARHNKQLIGYAIALRIQVPQNKKIIAWITQLVVHRDFRQSGVAKRLLYSVWGFSNDYAWGLISASPYAVRALEKATRRRCDTKTIKSELQTLLQAGQKNVHYIQGMPEYLVNSHTARINTNFYVDHSDVDLMIEQVTAGGTPWVLGDLVEGWEWIAFTFQSQKQIPLSGAELRQMLAATDDVVKTAYSRMILSHEHKWLHSTSSEVDFIIRECGVHRGSRILDFGCGNGRHTLCLAEKGMSTIGVDYTEIHIDAANKRKNSLHVSFHVGDCRELDLGEGSADVALCLYDVVGSYVDNSENLRILQNLYRHVVPGGFAVVSVMNYDLTLAIAKNKFVLSNSPDKLLDLPASNTMESTGNIFNPDYYLVDTEEQVVYRKEQFRFGDQLPIELIVRDRRFTKNEISDMCRQVGFNVLFSRYVRLGDWDVENVNGKEILVKCQKPLN